MSRRPSDTLFMTDGEIADRIGMSALEWQQTAKVLERAGLPSPDPLFHNRRYWPAVRAYLDRRAGLVHDAPPPIRDGEEKWDGDRGRRSRARA